MTDSKAIAAVDQLLGKYARFGIDLGLDRILLLLDALDNPHRKVPIIHVAGTNGKGSVCAYLSSILTAAGFQAGRYTSPHLVTWTERICINDVPVSEQHLMAALEQVEQAIDPDVPTPTQFEVLTAAAWILFAEAQVDIAVIEVGLGGRLDATNVCDRPLATLITSIGMDHWQRLGPTLADIAREKAGILKPGCPAIIGSLPAEATEAVRECLQRLNCPAIWPKPAQWTQIAPPNTQVPWAMVNDIPYPLPLLGDMQLQNSALAIATILQLRQQGWEIPDQAIQAGMARVSWPGRLQWITWKGHPLLIDGAHNPAAAQALRRYIDQLAPPSVHWLMGMLSTKDHAATFKTLLRPGDRLTLVPVNGHSTAAPSELQTLALELCPNLTHCETQPTLSAGLASLFTSEEDPQLRILCGSLYLVGELFAQLEMQMPA